MPDELIERLLRLCERNPTRLKRLYRSLARRSHPDAEGGDARSFLRLREAYLKAHRILILEEEGARLRALRESESEGHSRVRDAERESRARGAGRIVVPMAAPRPSIAQAPFYGVEYWKLKSPDERLAFHLRELSVFAACAPPSPSLWRPRFVVLPDDGSRPWILAIKRLLQVAPALAIDRRIVAAVRRLDDYTASNLLGNPRESLFERTGEAALSFIAACLRAYGIPCKRGGEAAASSLKLALDRFDRCRVPAQEEFISGYTGFRMCCEALMAALGELCGFS